MIENHNHAEEKEKIRKIYFAKIISQSRFYLASTRFMNSFFFLLTKKLTKQRCSAVQPAQGKSGGQPGQCST